MKFEHSNCRVGDALAIAALFILASAASADPADAVCLFRSHGGSCTAIATGEGYTYFLSVAHCFDGYLMTPRGQDRSRPMLKEPIVIESPHPAPGAPKKFGFTLIKVGQTDGVDLSLFKLNFGPVPYVTPVAPLGAVGNDCWSIGFDELETPPQIRPARIVGMNDGRYATDAKPWHGRSGGALIDKRTGLLIGVVSSYSGPSLAEKKRFPKGTPFDVRLARHEHGPGQGFYVSLPAIHAFLTKAGVMNGSPIGESQDPFAPEFRRSAPPPRYSPGPCPGGSCPIAGPRYGPCPGGSCPIPR